jgi:hypothetical protein
MKFDELRSMAHNIADSLASGFGELIGVYEMDVFGEAGRSPEGFIEVDFLTGTSSGGHPSAYLTRAIALYGEALPSLCEKHGTSPSAVRQLRARYFTKGLSTRFVVTVEDTEGRRSTDEYVGLPGRRARVLDSLGRIRTQRRAGVCTGDGGNSSKP